jgi:hypothetical protein
MTKEGTTANSTYKKLAVQWLNEPLCFVSSFVVANLSIFSTILVATFSGSSILIKIMESFTNGGLILVKEKLEENPNYFLQPTSFLSMILETENV